jgi:hypothetical protein
MTEHADSRDVPAKRSGGMPATDGRGSREELVGYLCGALDDAESRSVELELADPQRGPPLRRDLDLLRLAIGPLTSDREVFRAPAGLADRTLAFVAAQSQTAKAGPAGADLRPTVDQRRPSARLERRGPALSPDASGPRPARSGAWLDRVVLGATALAACVLVAPLLLDWVQESRELRAKRNLQRVGLALQGYAESHRFYPTPPDAGPLSRAGLYAPTLVSEQRIVADDGALVCPDSALARRGGFRVPSLEEVQAAVGTPEFDRVVAEMGGDYGYTLGYRDTVGQLHPNLNRRRAHFPIMSDAPDDGAEQSGNHPDGIHHVLYEDGHVQTVRRNALHAVDHLFRNRLGLVAAGVDPEDAVIGQSRDRP